MNRDELIAAAEPLIRADERVKADASGWRVHAMQARQECAELRRERADLRAKVQAMADDTERDYRIDPGGYLQGLMRGFERVLVLIDGATDE